MARFLPGASPTRRSVHGHAASQGRKAAACRFIDECLVFVADVEVEVEVRIVHGVFATWWRRNGFGEKVPPSNTMSRRLTEHGIPTKNRGKHGRWKVGIEIVQEYME